jgi:LacI family transcriptional regulator, repressor for deo operon, udp, cdd, tsx, nupC, and nupG
VTTTSRACPADVALAGFDDSRIALTTDPQLTTMRQPLDEIAAHMVELLLEIIDSGADVKSATFPTTLVKRASA